MTDRNSHPAPEPHPQSEPSDAQIPLADLIRIRYQKACDLQARGINPYPYRYDRDHEIAALLADFDTLAERQTAVRIAGRVMLIRKMGKVFFADLRDQSDRIQIYLKIDTVGEDQFRLFDAVDLGERTLLGHRRLDPADPVFAGHFPGYPVYPGVLQVEMVGQLALCLTHFLSKQTLEIPADTTPIAVRALAIHAAQYLEPLHPGDDLELHAVIIAEDGMTATAAGQIVKAGRVASYAVQEVYLVE